MTKNFFYFTYLALIVVIFSGCQSNTVKPSADYMVLDKITFVESFPKNFTLEQGDSLRLGLIGIQNLSIQDTLLIVSTTDENGYWSIFSLPQNRELGKYLMKGKGPGELLYSPRVGMQYFEKGAEGLSTRIYDFSTGKLYNMDVTKTIQNKELVINLIEGVVKPNLLNFCVLKDDKFFCKELNNDYNQQQRYVLENGEMKITPNLEKLNLSTVSGNGGFNILDAYTKCNPADDMIVEAAMDLNQINLYSIEGDFGVTICTGRQIDNIGVIQGVERRNKVVNYKYLNVYPSFFGALYVNDTNENIHSKKSKKNVIQFFNWKGEPIASVELGRNINCYDIDFKNKYLYTLNYETEEIYKYSFTEALDYLLKNSL